MDAIALDTDLGSLLVHKADLAMTVMIGRDHYWEPEISAVLRKYLQLGDTFVDVGANIGYHSALAGQLVGNTGKVISIEPDPQNVELLRENLRRLCPADVTVFEAAALEHSGSTQLWRSQTDFGNHTTVPQKDWEVIEVQALRLDDVLPASENIRLIKVDAELADHRVVQGMEGIIRSSNPAIIVEFLPADVAKTGNSPAEIISYYRSLQYEIFVLAGVSAGPHSPNAMLPGANSLSPIPAPQDAIVFEVAKAHPGGMCNLLLLPL